MTRTREPEDPGGWSNFRVQQETERNHSSLQMADTLLPRRTCRPARTLPTECRGQYLCQRARQSPTAGFPGHMERSAHQYPSQLARRNKRRTIYGGNRRSKSYTSTVEYIVLHPIRHHRHAALCGPIRLLLLLLLRSHSRCHGQHLMQPTRALRHMRGHAHAHPLAWCRRPACPTHPPASCHRSRGYA